MYFCNKKIHIDKGAATIYITKQCKLFLHRNHKKKGVDYYVTTATTKWTRYNPDRL